MREMLYKVMGYSIVIMLFIVGFLVIMGAVSFLFSIGLAILNLLWTI